MLIQTEVRAALSGTNSSIAEPPSCSAEGNLTGWKRIPRHLDALRIVMTY